jgi:hypothetical protein
MSLFPPSSPGRNSYANITQGEEDIISPDALHGSHHPAFTKIQARS